MAKTLKEIRDMASPGGRHTWRLRSLDEEDTASARQNVLEGSKAFSVACERLEDGDRERAVAALKTAIALAEKAIETIEK